MIVSTVLVTLSLVAIGIAGPLRNTKQQETLEGVAANMTTSLEADLGATNNSNPGIPNIGKKWSCIDVLLAPDPLHCRSAIEALRDSTVGDTKGRIQLPRGKCHWERNGTCQASVCAPETSIDVASPLVASRLFYPCLETCITQQRKLGFWFSESYSVLVILGHPMNFGDDDEDGA
ncbi:hypothetical protein Cob_v007753 [Colletotrichum orbiculare MAFF 240422]|uniref:Secreted protein n=1 Tax=Colletotrichum orbiculare (strain 104-T / ATCC 96160 / CBS 514.97 / LARS 414 / MAFF 240422) TaxID=1213857 RepID=A0A484FNI1_COLOR|nr:hypothetical protein Cob_v007753 [Colletotrichum orbiculare MAFF 240422]